MNQAKKILQLLSDGKPHRTDQILEVCYGSNHLGLARIGSRINDLVKSGTIFIDEDGNELMEYGKRRGWKDKEKPSLYWYRVKINNTLFNEPLILNKKDTIKYL